MGRRRAAALALVATTLCAASSAPAEDLASVVARAREQVENGAYSDALKTLSGLPAKGVPSTLAVEAGLLETTAAIVTKGVEAGQAACAKAIVAANYDPDVAREQSPKVRAACKAAAAVERKERLARAGVTLSELTVEKPEVAWQPVRISTGANSVPGWLRVAARVTSSALEGSFDLALAPSLEGPLRGTLDPSWLRPDATLTIELVAQDRFGDLGGALRAVAVKVPKAEALVALGQVPEKAVVSIDGSPVKVDASGRVAVSPGGHRVAMRLPNGASAEAEVEIARGSVARLALSPQKASSGNTLAWIATGTTLALGVAGGVLFLSAASRTSEIEELSARREDGSGLPATEYSDIRSKDEDRKTFMTAGTGLLIAGGVTGALALTLWLWPDSAPKEGSARAQGAALPFASLAARVGPGTVSLTGSF